jgi:hypothetical protein
MQDMVRAEDPQVGEQASKEAILADGELAEGQVDEEQEAGSGQADDAERVQRERDEEPHDLSDEIEVEAEDEDERLEEEGKGTDEDNWKQIKVAAELRQFLKLIASEARSKIFGEHSIQSISNCSCHSMAS